MENLEKQKIGIILMIIGILGIFFPVIPAFISIGIAFILMFPTLWEKIKAGFNSK